MDLLHKTGLDSIQARLTAIALCFIAGTSIAVGIAGFRLTVNFENERFRDHFNLLASYLATNAELGVLLGNEKMLESLTENMLTVRDVQIIEISGKNDEMIIQSAREEVPANLGVVSVPVVSAPMESADSPFLSQGGAGEVVGQVKLSYSHASLDQLKRLLAIRFVIISLLLAIVPIVMYWMLSRAISAPLQGILAVAAQVSRGRMDVRARGGSLQETRTLAGAINEMLDALALQREKLDAVHAEMARQQVLAEVGKFSMIVAHEIKNPLAIIKGSLDVLKKDTPLEPELKIRLMGFLDEEIARINKLIEDFLLFARPRRPAWRQVSLKGLLASLGERFKLMQGETLLHFQAPEVEPDLELCCDQQILERALLNIVRNALEVSGVNKEVWVVAALANRCLTFTVEDNGPGIADEDLERIFAPFFSTKSKGTGLGLAIAREIVDAHGGSISVTNRESGGACFMVRLPLERAG
ncbi:MAG: HAMP domain-containing protein [Proteobacteria bacterium]|nr:HAMP domain-containing protein [Pseudomonadota bacterium]MBU4295733.1 HAMP domain-containing protein [Pseudomonadota bacterium]MCG2747152.1 ATP-binding protein [Desulfobulbaceae bacterium]